MVEKDIYCADILVQVAAVNSALNGFSKELLAQHVRTCVADDLRAQRIPGRSSPFSRAQSSAMS